MSLYESILNNNRPVFNPSSQTKRKLFRLKVEIPSGIPFKKSILKTILFTGLFALWATPCAADATSLPPGQYADFTQRGQIGRFSGEHLYYNVSFMLFDNALTADVHFYENKGTYYSILKAETKGFVGFFTDSRKHYYKSTFDVVDNGRRLRTRKFEREVTIGDDVERTLHYLDYNKRTHFWFLYKNNKLVKTEREPIPEGVFFDDILAAFYNFRNSVYGPLEFGKRYKIDTIPDKTMKDITVYIYNKDEIREVQRSEGRRAKEEILLKVRIPKEVFKTESGELIFWGSPHFIPLETTVKDYVLLGDLNAKFQKRRIEKLPSKKFTSDIKGR